MKDKDKQVFWHIFNDNNITNDIKCGLDTCTKSVIVLDAIFSDKLITKFSWRNSTIRSVR